MPQMLFAHMRIIFGKIDGRELELAIHEWMKI